MSIQSHLDAFDAHIDACPVVGFLILSIGIFALLCVMTLLSAVVGS